MHAERGMRRLEAEWDSVRRERMVRRGEARARRRCHRCCHRWCRGRPRGGDGGGVDANDDDGTPLFSSDGEDGDDPSLPSGDDHGGALDDDECDGESLERELELSRLCRTHSALISIHQLRALWKITKIKFDRNGKCIVGLQNISAFGIALLLSTPHVHLIIIFVSLESDRAVPTGGMSMHIDGALRWGGG